MRRSSTVCAKSNSVTTPQSQSLVGSRRTFFSMMMRLLDLYSALNCLCTSGGLEKKSSIVVFHIKQVASCCFYSKAQINRAALRKRGPKNPKFPPKIGFLRRDYFGTTPPLVLEAERTTKWNIFRGGDQRSTNENDVEAF